MSLAVAAAVERAGGTGPGVRWAEWQLALPLLVAFLAFFVGPLLILVVVSASGDEKIALDNSARWRKFLTEPFNWKVPGDTLKLGFLTVAATLLVGYPLALVYRAARPSLQRLVLFIVILPLLTSVVVRTFAWIVILGREGVVHSVAMGLGLVPAPLRLLQTEIGLVIALTQIEMPLMLLPLLSVMNRIDPNLLDASEALGASKWRTLFRVTLPLSLPGLVAGCVLVFASSTTAFISQSIIGGNRLVYLTLLIWQESLVVYNWPLASVAALTLLISVTAAIAPVSLPGRRGLGHPPA